MKLLSPPAGKSRLAAENATQEVRAQELDKMIVEKRRELNGLDQSLLVALSEAGKKSVDEEKYWKEKIAALTVEVAALESRRRAAVVPLEKREKEVQDRESALLKREELASIRESENDAERQTLEDRLDDLSEREAEATTYALSLNSREFAIKLQEGQLAQRMDALTAILIESLEDTKKAQADAAARKAVLKGRDVSITEREKYVDMQIASFENREKAILDRYRTLQRAITETNLKNT